MSLQGESTTASIPHSKVKRGKYSKYRIHPHSNFPFAASPIGFYGHTSEHPNSLFNANTLSYLSGRTSVQVCGLTLHSLALRLYVTSDIITGPKIIVFHV